MEQPRGGDDTNFAAAQLARDETRDQAVSLQGRVPTPQLTAIVAESLRSTYILPMWTYSKNPVLQGATDQIKPTRTRESVLASAAELKIQRERDASQAMKEYHAERVATLAKTARLRAARLALAADNAQVKKPKRPK